MKNCFFENSVQGLPEEIILGNVVIPINSDKLITCSHLGMTHLVQARCRICPYNFECECSYLDTNSDKPLKLKDWVIVSEKESVETALDTVKAKLDSIVPEWLSILMICPFQTSLGDCENIRNAFNKIYEIDVKFSLFFDFIESEETTVLIFIWSRS